MMAAFQWRICCCQANIIDIGQQFSCVHKFYLLVDGVDIDVYKRQRKKETVFLTALNHFEYSKQPLQHPSNRVMQRAKQEATQATSTTDNRFDNIIDNDEEEDEVVGEVDVFLSQPKEDNQVHILQYPLRHSMVGIGSDRRVNRVKIRPQHGRIEVNVDVFPDDPVTADEGFGMSQPNTKYFDRSQVNTYEKDIGQLQKFQGAFLHLEEETLSTLKFTSRANGFRFQVSRAIARVNQKAVVVVVVLLL